jgi:hypothetical protein
MVRISDIRVERSNISARFRKRPMNRLDEPFGKIMKNCVNSPQHHIACVQTYAEMQTSLLSYQSRLHPEEA